MTVLTSIDLEGSRGVAPGRSCLYSHEPQGYLAWHHIFLSDTA